MSTQLLESLYGQGEVEVLATPLVPESILSVVKKCDQLCLKMVEYPEMAIKT